MKGDIKTKPVNYTLENQKITFEFLKLHLWSAADILRGSLDASEYRQPVMTLLFLKRLNDTFEENAENLIKKGMNKKEANSVVYRNGRFLFKIHCIGQNSEDYYKEIKTLHEDWLYHKAESIFKEKIDVLSKKVGVRPNKIIIKKLKNRWGSITKDNNMNLNVNLIKAPPDIIDYIIIHELCHFKIKGHSYNFWDLLKKYFPNYPKLIEWLNINGKSLLA